MKTITTWQTALSPIFLLSAALDMPPALASTPGDGLWLNGSHQKVKKFKETGFTDDQTGLTPRPWQMAWGVDWYVTDTNAGELYLVQDDGKVRATDGNKVVFSVARRS
ncbi:MAG: hypothetical protein P8X74_11360 [Reinekea sp.]|jgi:hypothetical protein